MTMAIEWEGPCDVDGGAAWDVALKYRACKGFDSPPSLDLEVLP